MSFRAPQYRRVITGIRSKVEIKLNNSTRPNLAAAKGLRVEPWANIFALVDGLGVISPYRTEAEAKAALEIELERRRKLRVAVHDDADNAPSGEDGGGRE